MISVTVSAETPEALRDNLLALAGLSPEKANEQGGTYQAQGPEQVRDAFFTFVDALNSYQPTGG